MPGCNFTATGSDFDVDAFLSSSPWHEFAESFHRGEPTQSAVIPTYKFSGLQIHISDCDEDALEPQIQDSLEFLRDAGAEIDRLAAFPGVEKMEFSIGLFWTKDTINQVHTLPPDFMRLAGEHGVRVSLCLYATS
jgi:hypothetical protein